MIEGQLSHEPACFLSFGKSGKHVTFRRLFRLPFIYTVRSLQTKLPPNHNLLWRSHSCEASERRPLTESFRHLFGGSLRKTSFYLGFGGVVATVLGTYGSHRDVRES